MSVLVLSTRAEAPDLSWATGLPERVRVLVVSGEVPEAAAPDVARAVAADPPRVIVAPAGSAERILLGVAAAALGAPVFTLVRSLAVDGDVVRVTHGVFGALAERTVEVTGPVGVLLSAGPASAGDPRAVEVEHLHAAPEGPLTLVASTPAPPASASLTTARRIVAVGRGVTTLGVLALAHDLADALGAELACTRPIAETRGWLGHDRVIGASGLRVAPELYVALGVSGQWQHVVGARDAARVVVVNSDPAAPYVGQADVAVVGAIDAIVPELLRALATQEQGRGG